MKSWLIPDWRNAWRFLTVQASAGVVLLATAYDYMPTVREYLPEGWVKWAALLIIVARILKQQIPDAKSSAFPQASSAGPSVK